jgi:hypothetical protein
LSHARADIRSRAGRVALVLLGLVCVWLAAAPATAGSRIVLATAGGSPDWLLGPLRWLGADYLAGDNAGWAYYGGLLLAMALYATVLVCVKAFSLRTLAIAVVAVNALFLLAPPLLSQDVFSYIAYARLGTEHGLNPYSHSPNDIPFDAVYGFAGSKAATNVYGPLFTVASYPFGLVPVPLAFWILKAVAFAATLGVVWFTGRAAVELGNDPRLAVAAVGLSPLTTAHVVGGAHNEALTMLLVVAGVWLFVRRREQSGSFVAALGPGVKASAAVVLPFMLAAARDRWRTLAAMLAAAGVSLVVALLAFGSNALDGLGLISDNQNRTSKYSLPHKGVDLVELLVGNVDRDAWADAFRLVLVVLLATLVVWLLWRVLRDRDWWIDATGWATLGVLVASAWLVPWYLLWLLPFAALASDRRLLVACTAFSTYTLAIAIPF